MASTEQRADELQARIEAAEDYFWEHPYLQLEPRSSEAPQRAVPQQAYEILQNLQLERDASTIPPTILLKKEQKELDRLLGLVAESIGEHPFQRLGLIPNAPTLFAFVSHMFVHAGWLHLFGNLLLLFIAGPAIEDMWGRLLYAVFYLTAGLAAAGLFIAIYPDLQTPMVGASGAISGVMGAFLVRHWHTKIRYVYWFGWFWYGTSSAPAWVMLPLWFLHEILMAMLMDTLASGGGGVAHWAHIGGFTFGVVAALAIRYLKVEERFITSALESKTILVANPTLERALEARAAGDQDAAWRMLSRELDHHPGNLNATLCDIALALWDVGREQGKAQEAAPALLRVIREEIRAGESELAIQHWLELTAYVQDFRAEPLLLVKIAQLLIDTSHTEKAVQALRQAVDERYGPVSAAIAVRVAYAARHLDPDTGLQAAQLAFDAGDLDPTECTKLEQLIAEVKEERKESHV